MAGLRRPFEGERDAGLLSTRESDARGVLGGREPDEPDPARLASAHELDRDLDLREGDLERVALGGSRNPGPDTVHASNVVATSKIAERPADLRASTAAQQLPRRVRQASLTRYPTPGSEVIRSRNSPLGSAAAIFRRNRLT